jgi:hypothetical protein
MPKFPHYALLAHTNLEANPVPIKISSGAAYGKGNASVDKLTFLNDG